MPASLTATAEPTEAPAAPPQSAVIADIRGFGFPYELRVAAGTPITWVNHDNVPHDVTALDGSWASPTLAQGQVYARTFAIPERYPYRCVIHPYMQAVLIVE